MDKKIRRGTRRSTTGAGVVVLLVVSLAIPALASSYNAGVYYHNGCACTGSHSVSSGDDMTTRTTSSSCDLVDAYHKVIYNGTGVWATTGLKASPAILLAVDIDGHDFSKHRAKEGGSTDGWNYLS